MQLAGIISFFAFNCLEKLQIPFKSRRVDEAFDEVMRQWMPVARACFRTAARQPSAKVAFQSEQRLFYRSFLCNYIQIESFIG